MINMSDLQPILSDMGEAVTADVIERIKAIDKDVPDQKTIDDVNAEWNRRFRETFFGGGNTAEAQTQAQAGGSTSPTEEELLGPEEETVEEKTRYEDLFKEGE